MPSVAAGNTTFDPFNGFAIFKPVGLQSARSPSIYDLFYVSAAHCALAQKVLVMPNSFTDQIGKFLAVCVESTRIHTINILYLYENIVKFLAY